VLGCVCTLEYAQLLGWLLMPCWLFPLLGWEPDGLRMYPGTCVVKGEFKTWLGYVMFCQWMPMPAWAAAGSLNHVRDFPPYARFSRPCRTCHNCLASSISFRPFTKALNHCQAAAGRSRPPPGLFDCLVYAQLCLTLQYLWTISDTSRTVYIVQTIHKSARAAAGWLSGLRPLSGLCPTLQELSHLPGVVYIIWTVHLSTRTAPKQSGRRRPP
jgi:hypothetical protein